MTAIITETSNAQINHHCNSSTAMIHRNQHQIRAHFLNSLGIVRAQASPTTVVLEGDASIDATNHTKDQQQQPTQHENLKYNAAVEAQHTTKDTSHSSHVSFCDTVEIRAIPSHRDYDAPTRCDLWNSVSAVAEIVRRNTLEYTAEGWSFAGVLEEDAFVPLPSGELLHPATYQKQQQLAQQRKRQKKKKSYAYKSVAQCLSFSSTVPAQQSGKSRRSSSSRRRTTKATGSRRKTVVAMASQ